jgi:hypothetical protein
MKLSEIEVLKHDKIENKILHFHLYVLVMNITIIC